MKVTVDKALIEQAIAAIELAQDNLRPHGDNCFLHEEGEYNSCFCGLDSLTQHLLTVTEALCAVLAEPAVEPVAEVIECGNLYAKVKLSGEAWGNTKVGDKFYGSPPPPAEVPLLTELDIALMWGEESLDTTSPESCYVLGVLRGEAAVRRKAGL